MSRRRTAAALFLAALCFRPQLVGVTPLLPTIQKSLHISHAVSGLLVTVPVLCMGVFAPAGSFIPGLNVTLKKTMIRGA